MKLGVIYIFRFELITSFIYLYNEHFELIARYFEEF